MNKSLITNSLAILLIVIGFWLPEPWGRPVLFTGLFAFAGAATNALAIHMLFEKIPGFYGSGVIVSQFETFKKAIESLIMEQFFSKAHLDAFLSNQLSHIAPKIDLRSTLEAIDLTPAWLSLVAAIKESSLHRIVSLFGGKKALNKLQTPFEEKLRSALIELAESEDFQQTLQKQLQPTQISETLYTQIQEVVVGRLEALTPEMVKDIIHSMIKKHLGWLVIWGGVAGGLMGFASSFLPL